jgi:tripartite-type tricarboxylate transporter receptor subunit TctC
MLKPNLAVCSFVAGAMLTAAAAAWAQNYPIKYIRIVTAEAGGGSDFVARLTAQGLSAGMGQPVIVDNRGSGLKMAALLS